MEEEQDGNLDASMRVRPDVRRRVLDDVAWLLLVPRVRFAGADFAGVGKIKVWVGLALNQLHLTPLHAEAWDLDLREYLWLTLTCESGYLEDRGRPGVAVTFGVEYAGSVPRALSWVLANRLRLRLMAAGGWPPVQADSVYPFALANVEALMTSMGVDAHQAVSALLATKGNMDRAVEKLLSCPQPDVSPAAASAVTAGMSRSHPINVSDDEDEVADGLVDAGTRASMCQCVPTTEPE